MKANCIVLRREYKLEEILKDDKDLEKVMKNAFAECTKGFELVKARRIERVKKLLQTTGEIYKGEFMQVEIWSCYSLLNTVYTIYEMFQMRLIRKIMNICV